MPTYSFTYLFNSNPLNGANVDSSSGGSSFSLDISRYPIKMPKECRNVTISAVSASIPYVTPNIIIDINNFFYFNYLGNNYVVQIPTGLYSLSSLQTQLSSSFVNLILPSDIFTFIGNGSTQKTSIQFNYANTFIDFTQNKTFRQLMGYDSIITPPAPSTIGQITTANNIANFDTLQSYLITCDLTSGNGIPLNGISSRGIIASIPISGQPGSRLTYSPSVLIIVNANELIGQTRTSARFQILNQDGGQISMLDQEWSITLQFSYDL
jgi:hypothetical protein